MAARNCSRSIDGSPVICRISRLRVITRVDIRYTKEPPCGCRARSRQRLRWLAARPGHYGGNVRKIHRLVTARGRLGMQVPRQEVGTVRLEEQPVRWNSPHELQEVRTAPLIADPTGDADRQPELEITLELRGAAGETVRYSPGERRPVLAQDGDEIPVCLALVQEHRLAAAGGKLQLAMKTLALGSVRRVVAEVIEPALAYGDDLRGGGQLAELRQDGRRELRGVMGMYARGGEEPAGVLPRECDRGAGAPGRGARDDHLHDTGGFGARDHGAAIGIIAVVRQIDPDVDQRCCAAPLRRLSGEGGRRRPCDIVLSHGCGAFYWRGRVAAGRPARGGPSPRLAADRGCAGGFPGTPGGRRGHSATRCPLGGGRESHRERLLPAGCGRPGGSGPHAGRR